jgi:dihydrodipicolinate reductase
MGIIMINVVVNGVTGKMGYRIIKKVVEQENMNLVAAIYKSDTLLKIKMLLRSLVLKILVLMFMVVKN